MLTFKKLQGNSGYFSTSFKESIFKRKKIKLLIEKLSTVEQLKKSMHENRKCPICRQDNEIFNHVWMCINQQPKKIQTRIYTKFFLWLAKLIVKLHNLFYQT
jgi:hypothetical protein